MTSEIHPESEWRAHLAAGRLMIQRSRSSGGYVFYPRIAEPGTGNQDLEWVAASGEGTIHAVTIVRRKPPAADYNIVLVDLAEGVRLMSRVVDAAPDRIAIGATVRARIDEQEGAPLLVFVPA
jgi:uncharacterized OB-fold protein